MSLNPSRFYLSHPTARMCSEAHGGCGNAELDTWDLEERGTQEEHTDGRPADSPASLQGLHAIRAPSAPHLSMGALPKCKGASELPACCPQRHERAGRT